MLHPPLAQRLLILVTNRQLRFLLECVMFRLIGWPNVPHRQQWVVEVSISYRARQEHNRDVGPPGSPHCPSRQRRVGSPHHTLLCVSDCNPELPRTIEIPVTKGKDMALGSATYFDANRSLVLRSETNARPTYYAARP